MNEEYRVGSRTLYFGADNERVEKTDDAASFPPGFEHKAIFLQNLIAVSGSKIFSKKRRLAEKLALTAILSTVSLFFRIMNPILKYAVPGRLIPL